MDHPLRASRAPFEGAIPADRQSRIRGIRLVSVEACFHGGHKAPSSKME